MTDFAWTKLKERAALEVATDILSNEDIAKRAGVTTRALDKWKAHPAFAERVRSHLTAFREAILTQGIADKANRVQAANDRWKRMQSVIAERAEEMQGDAAGGASGLLVRQVKVVGGGENAREVEEFAVDTGLLRELRELEKQAAQELGQWTERSEQKITNSGVIGYRIVAPVKPTGVGDPDGSGGD